MASSNPYAPPQHDELAGLPLGPGGIRLAGDTLICDKGASLPGVCLFSGDIGGERVSRTLSWAPQWFVLVAAMSPLIGAILYFAIRKTGKLDYSLSSAAKKRSQSGLWIALGGSIGAVLLAVVAGSVDQPVLSIFFILAALTAIVVGSIRARLFTIARIDKQRIHLKLRPTVARAFERHFSNRA